MTIELEKSILQELELHACVTCLKPYAVSAASGVVEVSILPNSNDIRMGPTPESLAGQALSYIPIALDELPVLPEISQKVLALIDDPDSSMTGLADLIRYDTVISAKVLNVSNSALYGGLTQITDLSNACARLGMLTVPSIVQTIANENWYKTDDSNAQELLKKLWHHTVATAYLSNEIAVLLSSPNPSVYFLEGLVHSIGKIALVDIIYSAKDGALSDLREKPELVHEIIANYYALVGLHIVQAWNLPSQFTIAAYCHHTPGSCPDDEWKLIAHTVSLANSITHVS